MEELGLEHLTEQEFAHQQEKLERQNNRFAQERARRAAISGASGPVRNGQLVVSEPATQPSPQASGSSLERTAEDCQDVETSSDWCWTPDADSESDHGTPDVVCDSLPHDAGSEPDLLTSDDDDDDSDYSLPEEPRLPFADQLLYTHQPLTAGIIQQLQEDLEQPVNYHGRQQFNDALNLEVFGDNGLARCIECPGSWIVQSSEQSGKTTGKAALALVSMRMGQPLVIMIKDVKSNAEKVAQDIRILLEPFDMDVFYCSGKRSWEAVHSLATARFKIGQTVLIMSVHANELKCLNDFLADNQIAGITVVADESDNLWSSEITDPTADDHNLCSKREIQLYKLLGSATTGSPVPLSPGSRVRSFVQVSATHIATLIWHCQWKLPCSFVSVDKAKLLSKDYALEQDVQLVGTLQPEELSKGHDYAIHSDEVVKELRHFNEDPRCGRLMMVCLTPYVRCADKMTSFSMAETILREHVPDAVCLVVHGNGVNALYSGGPGPSSSSAPDYSTAPGEVIMRESGSIAGGDKRKQRTRPGPDRRGNSKARQASEGIEQFDTRYGSARPIIVVGYNMIGRCASIRSRKRVITHIIGGYQNGRSKGDLEQMLLRGNGQTRSVRARNGYTSIRAVVLADDYNTIQNLYDFTQEALKLSGTGRVQDLGNWNMGNYAERYLPLIQNKRLWCRKSLGVPDMHRVRVGNKLVMAQALPSAARMPQRQGPARRRRRHEETTGHRLLRCIWAVARDRPNHEFTRPEWVAYLHAHPEILSWREFMEDQHQGAYSAISSRAHCIKRCPHREGYSYVTEKGLKFCRENFEQDNA
ncbi:TPA: hypothetical protein ACH3X2_000073 [Trebouxia sp. C0005]